jgi:hypothetical protein
MGQLNARTANVAGQVAIGVDGVPALDRVEH